IDLRVYFLRPGKGNYFVATGTILRKGSKVAVVRTELCNDQKVLIAAGTGTYLVG
ncbi:MAG: thioesterase family protein, partial [Proteobacteria bacterium]|nr:thioesterase family protein [Pseudomonadota bacterium]